MCGVHTGQKRLNRVHVKFFFKFYFRFMFYVLTQCSSQKMTIKDRTTMVSRNRPPTDSRPKSRPKKIDKVSRSDNNNNVVYLLTQCFYYFLTMTYCFITKYIT